MKNILLGTDFSLNSQIAAMFAGELTCRIGGRLIVFHALPPLETPEDEDRFSEPFLSEKESQKKLDALASELHKQYNISVSRVLKPGLVKEELPSLAQNLHSELVIIGAQGENLKAERALGSFASETLKNDRFPVICVPANSLLNLSAQLALIQSNPLALSNHSAMALLTDFNTQFSS